MATLVVRNLGRQPYEPVWQDMKTFTDQRTFHTEDEIWILEHDPVFTLGQAGKPEHVLCPVDIPVIKTDSGGQVTYPGSGQLVFYFLLDIRRMHLGPRILVSGLESSVVNMLSQYDIKAVSRRDAPGVYVDGAKIAALGLRIRKMCSYHGLSFNLDMDLSPFRRINPCGYPDLPVTQLNDLAPEKVSWQQAKDSLLNSFAEMLGYSCVMEKHAA
ncbi:Octanoyltransferase [invertebrate metagenome]|uniref:lipoyl(octanoyl) transferase n=1 Tax=invertebrate metagenome TaxID=1711999 RepID=A0A2H9TB45_9ZZZZ